jgi:hypothetical protein
MYQSALASMMAVPSQVLVALAVAGGLGVRLAALLTLNQPYSGTVEVHTPLTQASRSKRNLTTSSSMPQPNSLPITPVVFEGAHLQQLGLSAYSTDAIHQVRLLSFCLE